MAHAKPNLNTSYVSVKPCIKAMFCSTISNLNTSYATVKQSQVRWLLERSERNLRSI